MDTLSQSQDEFCFFFRFVKKLKSRKLLSLFILSAFLLLFYGNSYGQISPGGTDINVMFWLRSDFVHNLNERPGEGGGVVAWADIVGKNHWGEFTYERVPQPYPTLSYDGMNFHEAVNFTSKGQKLGSMHPIATNNNTSYYIFIVSELETAQTTGTYAAMLTLAGGYNYNNHGWAGSGRGLWWTTNTTYNTARTRDTYATYKPYGITAYLRPNTTSSSNPMHTTHNGRRFIQSAIQTGEHEEHGFIGASIPTVGPSQGYLNAFVGKIQEIIMLSASGNSMIPEMDLWKIQSYLAVKYGQTLESGTGTFQGTATTGTHTYVGQPNWYASDGTMIWTNSQHTGYVSGMFGLGYDTKTSLNQRQGRSADDKMLTAFTGTTLYRMNKDNPTNLSATDKSYVIFGHNAQLTGETAYTPASNTFENTTIASNITIKGRSNLVYKAQTTGATSHTISFKTDVTKAEYIILSNSINFTPGSTRIYKLTNGTATGVEVKNGDYISFVTNVDINNTPVASVTVSPKTLTLTVGGATGNLTATVLPTNAANPALNWTSSNNAVATVINGVVTPVAAGSTRITASSTDGSNKSDYCDVTVESPTVSVTGVSLNKATATINKGLTETLAATVAPANASNKEVSWTTNNSSVATVTNGVVTAVGGGTATITVTTADGGFTATCSVVVNVPVTGVDITLPNLTLIAGENSSPLQYTIAPSDASNKTVTWSSNDETVATVSTTGVVTAKVAGTATITITTVDGSFKDTCVVTVNPATVPVTGVTLNKSTATINKGLTETLTVTVAPANASNKEVSWTTSNSSVATVTNGVVTAVGGGTATITVTTADGGFTATCSVTVNVPVTGVSLNKTTLTFVVDDGDEELIATVLPTDATDKSVTWSVDDSTIVSLSGSGNGSRTVKGLKIGTTTVRVKTNDGGYEATCTITVNPRLVTSIEVQPSPSLSLVEGNSQQLTAKVSPDDATDGTVTWSIDKPEIATVSATGFVTAVKEGTATITVAANDASNVKTTCAVTVTKAIISVTGITLNKTTHTFVVGDDGEELIAMVLPADATDKSVTWSVDDSTIVSLSGSGNGSRTVKGLKIGTTTVRVKTTDGGYEATCTITVNPRLVTSITVTPSPLSLVEGNFQQLTANVSPDDATDGTVSWSIDKPEIATVSATGLVTAVKEGTATITVAANDASNVKTTCEVTVTKAIIYVTGVSLDKKTLVIEKGEEGKLTATVSPADATNKEVTWKTSDGLIASVDDFGNVTAHKSGTVTITVTTVDGGYTDTCQVTVKVSVTGVSLSPSSVSLVVGGSETLTATVLPLDATIKDVTWSIDKPEVATILNGVVTAVGVGTATVTVTTVEGNKTATCDVTVSAASVPVTGITLNKTELTLENGNSEMLTPTVTPDDATNKKVKWTSSDSSIVSVDENTGLVTAHKNGGPITITATTDDGGYTATCAVTVITSVTGVSLTPSSLSLAVGQNETLIATVSPEDASNKTVIWSSDKPAVATVLNGVVTAVGVGTATITVTAEGGYTATCSVTVTAAPISVTGITLNKTLLTLENGTSEILVPTIEPLDATNKKVSWTSSDPLTASVDENTGEVTAHKNGGPVTITVTADDGGYTATCAVTVITSVTDVSVSPTTLSFVLGGPTQTLTATVSPEEASNKNVTWSSDKPEVALVLNGVVSAVGLGTATITVTTVNNKTADCIVYVTAADVPVTDVAIDLDNLTLPEGGTGQLTAIITPPNATNQNVTWESSDDSIAEISPSGWVTAKKAGQVTVTVTTEDGNHKAYGTITITGEGEVKIFINQHLMHNLK